MCRNLSPKKLTDTATLFRSSTPAHPGERDGFAAASSGFKTSVSLKRAMCAAPGDPVGPSAQIEAKAPRSHAPEDRL